MSGLTDVIFVKKRVSLKKYFQWTPGDRLLMSVGVKLQNYYLVHFESEYFYYELVSIYSNWSEEYQYRNVVPLQNESLMDFKHT